MDMDQMAKNAEFFTRLWMELGAKMMTAGLSYSPAAPPAENGRTVRTNMFTAMSEFADEFMRSPQFLQLMKQSMDAAMGFRQQVNDFLTAARHDSQGTAREDIDSVLLNLRRLGSRILDRMDDIEARLDQISRRLDSTKTEAGDEAEAPAAGEPAGRDNGRSAVKLKRTRRSAEPGTGTS